MGYGLTGVSGRSVQRHVKTAPEHEIEIVMDLSLVALIAVEHQMRPRIVSLDGVQVINILSLFILSIYASFDILRNALCITRGLKLGMSTNRDFDIRIFGHPFEQIFDRSSFDGISLS